MHGTYAREKTAVTGIITTKYEGKGHCPTADMIKNWPKETRHERWIDTNAENRGFLIKATKSKAFPSAYKLNMPPVEDKKTGRLTEYGQPSRVFFIPQPLSDDQPQYGNRMVTGCDCWLPEERSRILPEDCMKTIGEPKMAHEYANLPSDKKKPIRKPVEGSPCVFPAVYKGKRYTGCITVGQSRAWCYVSGQQAYWATCTDECASRGASASLSYYNSGPAYNKPDDNDMNKYGDFVFPYCLKRFKPSFEVTTPTQIQTQTVTLTLTLNLTGDWGADGPEG